MTLHTVTALARYSFRFEADDDQGTLLDQVEVIVLPCGELWFVAPQAAQVDEAILTTDETAGLLAVTDRGELALSERWIREYVEEAYPGDHRLAELTNENIALIREAIESDQGWRNN